jgi:DNA-binding IclR family transcriptional regulator
MAFPAEEAVYGSDLETLLVLLCVFIGEAEGRPTTVTKIASHSGISRQSVYRKLDQLMELKKIERIGRNYHLAEGAVVVDKTGRLKRILREFVTDS